MAIDRTLELIVESVRAVAPANRRALIGIDGIGGSGKSAFADQVARHISDRPVLVLHVDDFFNPPHIRHARGRHSSDGFWLDAYNYTSLTAWALAPLSAAGNEHYRPACYDPVTAQAVTPETRLAPPDALVLVEGTFLHRDELAGFWDCSVYLDVAFEEAARRMAARDGMSATDARRLMQRYEGAQRTYFAQARPWERASFIVDNSDFTRPQIIDAAGAVAARWRPPRKPTARQ